MQPNSFLSFKFYFNYDEVILNCCDDENDKATVTRKFIENSPIFLHSFNYQVVNQFYDPEVLSKEYVMRGNAAILKCTIPSFVADFVHVVAWIDDEGFEFVPTSEKNFSGGKKENRNTKNSPKSQIPNFCYNFNSNKLSKQLSTNFTTPR